MVRDIVNNKDSEAILESEDEVNTEEDDNFTHKDTDVVTKFYNIMMLKPTDSVDENSKPSSIVVNVVWDDSNTPWKVGSAPWTEGPLSSEVLELPHAVNDKANTTVPKATEGPLLLTDLKYGRRNLVAKLRIVIDFKRWITSFRYYFELVSFPQVNGKSD